MLPLRAVGTAAFIVLALPWPASARQTRVLPATDRPLEITSVELFRIGGATAPDWAAFETAPRAGFDAAGRLHVLDTRANRVVTIGPDGRLLRTVGRQGGGPGEFRAAADLVVRPDGGTLVYDGLAHSLTEFDSAGALSGTWRLPPEIRPPAGLIELAPGRLLAPLRLFTMDGRLSFRDGSEATRQPIHLLTLEPDGRAHTTRIVDAWITPRPAGRSPFSPHAFATRLHWARFGSGFAVLDSVTWDIELRDAEGSLAGRIRRPFEPRPPTRADIAAARRDARARFIAPDGRPRVAGAGASGSGPQPPLLRRIEEGLREMTFADRVPLVLGLMSDADGRLWVRRSGDTWGEPGRIDVLDLQGDYLGTVDESRFSLPAAFGPEGLVATFETDALDAIVLVVKRIALRPSR